MWTLNELVTFTDNENHIKRKLGFPVGEYLIISYPGHDKTKFQIFNRVSGKPIFPTIFERQKTVLEIARWIDETYGDYLGIWETFPEADVFSLAKLSIESGANIFEIIQDIRSRKVYS